MSLSELFAKPLNPVPTRKELWASLLPSDRAVIAENPVSGSTSQKEISPSSAAVSSPAKEKTGDYRTSVLYSASRRPTVQEFLSNSYQRNPKPHLQTTGLSESRYQSQNQRIINFNKDKSVLTDAKITPKAKDLQSSSAASHKKNANSKVTGFHLESRINKVKSVEGREGYTELAGAPSSSRARITEKICTNNKDFTRPRFKTIVKNGSMVTIRLPPLKPKENSNKNDKASKEIGSIPTEIMAAEKTPETVSSQANKNLTTEVSLSKTTDSKIQCEGNIVTDNMITAKRTCSEEKMKEDLIAHSIEAAADTMLVDNSNDVQMNESKDLTSSNEMKFSTLPKNKQERLPLTTTSLTNRLTVIADLELPENRKQSNEYLPVVSDENCNNHCDNKMVMGNSQTTNSYISPGTPSDLALQLGVSEELTKLSGSQFTDTKLESQTAQIQNNQLPAATTGSQQNIDVDKNSSEKLQEKCNFVTEKALGDHHLLQQLEGANSSGNNDTKPSTKQNRSCGNLQVPETDYGCVDDGESISKELNQTDSCGNSQVPETDSDCVEDSEDILQGNDQTSDCRNSQVPETDNDCVDDGKDILQGNDQTSDCRNSQALKSESIECMLESDESYAELVFDDSDSNVEDDDEEEMKDEQISTDIALCNKPKQRSEISARTIDCEDGEILSSSDNEQEESSSQLALNQAKQDRDHEGLNSASEKTETRCKSKNVRKKKKKRAAVRKKAIQLTNQGTKRKAKNVTVSQKQKQKQDFAHREAVKIAKSDKCFTKSTATATDINNLRQYKDGAAADVKDETKEPSLLDSVAGAIVDVTIATDEKMVRSKPRGGSKEAKKLKKKKYKQKKRRMAGNEQPRKPRVKYEYQPPPVCKYYLMGSCNMGADCLFRHEGEVIITKKKEVCKFYTTDCCTKGDDCHYMHSEFPCMFFHSDKRCNRGDNCKFSHDPLTDEMTEMLDKYIQENQQNETESRITTEEEKQQQSSAEENSVVHHGMVLRSRPQPDMKDSKSTSTLDNIPTTNESLGHRVGSSENSKADNTPAEIQQSPYNLRRKRALSEDGERNMEQKSSKASRKDESVNDKERFAGKFLPGMYREISN